MELLSPMYPPITGGGSANKGIWIALNPGTELTHLNPVTGADALKLALDATCAKWVPW